MKKKKNQSSSGDEQVSFHCSPYGENGNCIYRKDSDGLWWKIGHDNGNGTHCGDGCGEQWTIEYRDVVMSVNF